MRAKYHACWGDRKQPDTFCFTLIILRSLSAWLLSKGTLGHGRNFRNRSLCFSSGGYKLILEAPVKLDDEPAYKVRTAHTLREAHDRLMSGDGSYDIVLLDIRMKTYPRLKLFSGEGLGKLIVERCPDTKIVVLTGILERNRLDGILRSLNPAGFLIKMDVGPKSLKDALWQVSKGNRYYSNSILDLIEGHYLSGIELDDGEREFLYLLSIGVPTTGIPDHLPWSTGPGSWGSFDGGLRETPQNVRFLYPLESFQCLSFNTLSGFCT